MPQQCILQFSCFVILLHFVTSLFSPPLVAAACVGRTSAPSDNSINRWNSGFLVTCAEIFAVGPYRIGSRHRLGWLAPKQSFAPTTGLMGSVRFNFFKNQFDANSKSWHDLHLISPPLVAAACVGRLSAL